MPFKELTIQNLLSFGPEAPSLELRPLNVFIGPNGSGKSNVIEAIRLLRSTTTGLAEAVRTGGGINEWIWKGSGAQSAVVRAVIQAADKSLFAGEVRQSLALENRYQQLECHGEQVESRDAGESAWWTVLQRDYSSVVITLPDGHQERHELRGKVAANESILAKVKDLRIPELAFLEYLYDYQTSIFAEWSVGRSAVFRIPQPADMPKHRLEEDFSNLGMFLNRLRAAPHVKKGIVEHLKELYTEIDDFDISVQGSTVEVFFTEGAFTIPARRLSDGTMRYLCLLAILCDPEPPEVICIEEPELGLHPDLLPRIADLLVEASERTQLIVTTHSDILVDALSETPESVVVVEKHNGQTQFKRLEKDNLAVWLEKYRLGDLWLRGEIGGTRW